MGKFFKNVAVVSKEKTVNGQTFLLKRPNALERIEFIEQYEEMFEEAKTKKEQSKASFKTNVLIVAYFVKSEEQFKGMTVTEVAQAIIDEAQEYETINVLADECWSLFNLKGLGLSAAQEASQES